MTQESPIDDRTLLYVGAARRKGISWKKIEAETGFKESGLMKQYKKRIGPLPSSPRSNRLEKQIVLYTTAALHAEISLRAMRAGVTLNQYLHNFLTENLGVSNGTS